MPTTPPSTTPSTPTTTTKPDPQQQTLYSIFALTHPPPPTTTLNPKTTMTELSFAKTFLSTLDSRPLKLPPDSVSNPKTLSLNGPYTLPKMPHAFARPSSSTSPSNNNQQQQKPPSINVLLKSTRNPVLSLTLPSQDPNTVTILALKERVAGVLKLGGTEKVRVLWRRKPVGDVRVLKELISEEEGEEGEREKGEMELGVMVMGYKDVGGGGDGSEKAEEGGKDVAMGDNDDADAKKVAQGPSGEEVLGGEEFWADLKGFLVQRIRDEGKAGEVFERFREGWGKR